jgi:hypothetical protein
MPFIGDTGQLSNIYEKNHETTTLRIHEGDTAFQAYNPADSHYKLITTLQEITDIGNVTSNTLQFSNAITGFTTTSNVGIANSTPTHTLDVGSKAYIDENASNTFWTSGTLYADKVLSETTEITNSVTTRDVLADKFFPKTNGFIEVTSNVGVLNTAPVHTLDIGANVQIDEYGSNTFWTSGNVYSEHYKGPNVTVSGSVDTDQLIVNDINSKDTDFVNFTSNVGVLNTAPVHTLDIGANVQIDEYGSNTFWTSGNVHADKYTGGEIQLSGVIRATDFILAGGSQATPTPDLQTISEVLASGGGAPFSSDRTLTLSNVTTALDASVIQSITTKSNVIGNNVTAVTVNSNLIGNNVTAVTVNSNVIGNNVTAVTVNSNLIGNNVTVVTVNSNLIGNNVTAVTVNSNLIGNNVTAVTVNSNLIGNNVTVVTVNSNLIGNNVTAVTVNSNLIGNNVTAVTVNSNVIGNNVSASFISGNGDLIFRKYSFGVNGISAYTVTGPGFTTAVNNPTLTLLRGQVYVFDNSTHYGSHPLQIRTSQGGTAYTNGVVDNGGGKLTFTVPMNAPIKLYYQCTNHSGMGNIIYIPLENLDTSQTLNLSNDLVVGTDKLVVDVSESRVGINKSTPTKTLDVTGEIACSSDLTVGGNLTVNGTTTTVNTTSLRVEDTLIELGKNNTAGTSDLGLILKRPTGVGLKSNVAIVYSESLDTLKFGHTLSGSDATPVVFDTSNTLAMSLNGSFVATGTVRGSSSLNPGSYLTGSAYNGGANQTFNVDATSTNTVNKVVARDGSGNFSAGTITASMSTSLNPGSYLTGSAYNGGTARTFNVDATSTNTANKVVARDGSGNFSAGTITASMSTSLTPGSYLTGSAYNGGTARTFNVDATSTNTANTVVARDASGNFSAGTITATLDGVASSISNQANSATITASVSAGNNTIVQRNSSGYVYANYFNTSPNDVSSGVTKVCVETSNDGFIRHGTPAAISTFLGLANSATITSTNANTVNTIVKRDASGNFNAGTITATFSGNGSGLSALNATNVSSGTLDAARIPSLNASKITAGTLDAARIPSLNASKITAGTLDAARIPNLNASKITAGALDAARIPSLNASKITAGTLDAARIPSLDASKITTGTLGRPISTTNGTFSGSVSFGSDVRQMINLYSTTYGIGIQSSTLYYRSGGGYAWFKGGVHSDTINTPGSGGVLAMRLDSSYNLITTGNVTAYSDKRVKTDIRKIEDPLNKLCSINGYTYKRTDTDDDKTHTGVLAQEVIEVLPEVVHGSEDTTYSVAYGNMVGLLIEAIKELKLEIDELKKSR